MKSETFCKLEPLLSISWEAAYADHIIFLFTVLEEQKVHF